MLRVKRVHLLDKMIALVEGAERNKTPNEIALFTLLTTLTIIFLVVIVTLYPIASYLHLILPIAMLIALTVCLIPTTIGGLYGDWYCRHGSCYSIQCISEKWACCRSMWRCRCNDF